MALLLILYASRSRQLAIARKERALAAELKERSAEIHENERKKIARDLHDGLSQNLSLARMSVDGLPEGNEKKQLQISLDQSFKELRRLLFNLRSLEDFSGPLDNLVRRECGPFRPVFPYSPRGACQFHRVGYTVRCLFTAPDIGAARVHITRSSDFASLSRTIESVSAGGCHFDQLILAKGCRLEEMELLNYPAVVLSAIHNIFYIHTLVLNLIY
jgi:hypothetical protein